MATSIVFEDFSDGSINVTDPGNPVWNGTGVFDQLMMAVNGNIQAQFDAGRIKGTDYANVYMNSMQAAMSEAMKFVLGKKLAEKQVDIAEQQVAKTVQEVLAVAQQAKVTEQQVEVTKKQVQSQDVQIAIGEVQLAENSEKWQLQKQVLGNQLAMSNVDVANKAAHTAKDLSIKDKQVESAAADIAFNTSKKTIMEQTRKDNIRSKAAEQFAEFMKYISAANVVPGPTDFQNMRGLITAMNSGIANPDAVATLTTSGADYVKP